MKPRRAINAPNIWIDEVRLTIAACFFVGASAYALNGWTQARDAATVIQAEIPYAANKTLWIDNEQVLFSGQKDGSNARSVARGGVYLWQATKRNVVQILENGNGASVLCHYRGHLYISFWRDEDRVVVQGPIHSLTTITYKRTETTPFQGVFNPYSCRYQQPPASSAPNRTVIEVLRDEHGFIEYEAPPPGSYAGNFFLIKPGGRSIPIPLHDVAARPRYSDFRQAYVFQYGGADLSSNADKHTWLVQPDGQVTDYKLPKGPWLAGHAPTMPVQDGLVLVSASIHQEVRGLYLLTGGRARRLIGGYVGAFAVAPDGCHVVVTASAGQSAQSTARMLVLDTCKGRG